MKKLTRAQKKVVTTAKLQGYTDGYRDAVALAEKKAKQADADLARKKKELHLEVLKQMREQYSAFGQMMQVLARAMESEKDQL